MFHSPDLASITKGYSWYPILKYVGNGPLSAVKFVLKIRWRLSARENISRWSRLQCIVTFLYIHAYDNNPVRPMKISVSLRSCESIYTEVLAHMPNLVVRLECYGRYRRRHVSSMVVIFSLWKTEVLVSTKKDFSCPLDPRLSIDREKANTFLCILRLQLALRLATGITKEMFTFMWSCYLALLLATEAKAEGN